MRSHDAGMRPAVLLKVGRTSEMAPWGGECNPPHLTVSPPAGNFAPILLCASQRRTITILFFLMPSTVLFLFYYIVTLLDILVQQSLPGSRHTIKGDGNIHAHAVALSVFLCRAVWVRWINKRSRIENVCCVGVPIVKKPMSYNGCFPPERRFS